MHRGIQIALTITLSAVMAVSAVSDVIAGKRSIKDVKSLPEQEQVKLALSGAPAPIAKEAGVMIFGADGQLTETRKSENGFICMPTIMKFPEPDPVCMDAAANQWFMDVMNNAPKPTNTVPGIAYMARGGSHFEKAGRVIMSGEGAKIVKEPPHWMIMWPFEASATKLPSTPNPSGVYIMFEGTPYAHLMIYQDPKKMK